MEERHWYSRVAALLCAAAAGLLLGGFLDATLLPARAARSGPPTSLGGYRLVWIREVPTGSDVRCYVIRERVGKTRGIWLCG